MATMTTIELKAFVPAKDFDLSKRFYTDLGFTIAWSSEELAHLHAGASGFLLQKFYRKEFAENLMLHLLVQDVESWWQRVQTQHLIQRYGVKAQPPEDRPWGLRDFPLHDPTGVLWRIGQHIRKQPEA